MSNANGLSPCAHLQSGFCLFHMISSINQSINQPQPVKVFPDVALSEGLCYCRTALLAVEQCWCVSLDAARHSEYQELHLHSADSEGGALLTTVRAAELLIDSYLSICTVRGQLVKPHILKLPCSLRQKRNTKYKGDWKKKTKHTHWGNPLWVILWERGCSIGQRDQWYSNYSLVRKKFGIYLIPVEKPHNITCSSN